MQEVLTKRPISDYFFNIEEVSMPPALFQSCMGVCSTSEHLVFSDYFNNSLHIFNYEFSYIKTISLPIAPYQVIPWEDGVLCTSPKDKVLYGVNIKTGRHRQLFDDKQFTFPVALTAGQDRNFFLQDKGDILHYRNSCWQTLPAPTNIRSLAAAGNGVLAYGGDQHAAMYVRGTSVMGNIFFKELAEAKPAVGYAYSNGAHFVVHKRHISKYDKAGKRVFKTRLPVLHYHTLTRISLINTGEGDFMLAYDPNKPIFFKVRADV